MRSSIKHILVAVALVLVVAIGGAILWNNHRANTANKTDSSAVHKTSSVMRTPINWQKSSETVAYPDVNAHPNLWIKVSKAKQRVYLIDDGKVLYTMYCSTGSGKSDTPTGTYHIQAERGTFFYNQSSNEGAKYWVSWKNHGEYLFHTVPTDANGNFVISEAKKLGKQAASLGCVRLSVPDAKWLYENIKEGTKVVITNN